MIKIKKKFDFVDINLGMETTTEEAKKYLSFKLGNEAYGVPIEKVQEIIGFMPATPVPGSPNYLEGVINLRGKIIPVLDLRTKLDMEKVPPTDASCIIILFVKQRSLGVVVDTVLEVLKAEQISESPKYGGTVPDYAVTGIIDAKEPVILLDIDKVLYK
jgi:purine-binding chemotaxis protein CheW